MTLIGFYPLFPFFLRTIRFLNFEGPFHVMQSGEGREALLQS